MHRDAKVSEYDRIMTIAHIKSLFENKEKIKKETKKGIGFITANKNEVDPPEPRTPDFFGYKTAGEVFEDALWRRTSEIALVPSGQNYAIVYRIDGIVVKQPEKTKEQIDYFHPIPQTACKPRY